MTYADNLELPNIASNYFISIRPRRSETLWTGVSGTINYADWSYGPVISVYDNLTGDDLIAATTAVALPTGYYYYDADAERLYINNGGTPGIVIATYELYLGTLAMHWYSTPTDNTTSEVFFDGFLASAPVIQQDTTDVLFGSVPIATSNVSIDVTDQSWNIHLYESSFSKAEIRIWHCVGAVTVANCSLIATGVCGNFSFKDGRIQIDVRSRYDLFSRTYASILGEGAYNVLTTDSVLVALDPSYEGTPGRDVFGKVKNLRLINSSYDTVVAPRAKTNRTWYVHNGQDNTRELALGVVNTASNTTTRTYLSNVGNTVFELEVGDRVWMDRSVGTDEYVLVTAVNTVSNYIDHDVIASKMASTSDQVRRGCFKDLYLIHGGQKYELIYNRDYSMLYQLSGDPGTPYPQQIFLRDSIETTYSLAEDIQSSDIVFGTVYGPQIDGLGTRPQHVVDTLKVILEGSFPLVLVDADFDSTWATLEAANTQLIGYTIPKTAGGSQPTLQEVVNDLLKTAMLKLYFTPAGLLSLVQTNPMTTPDETIMDDEIVRGSIEFAVNYDDIVTDVTLQYNQQEVNEASFSAQTTWDIEVASTTESKLLHQTVKAATFQCALIEEADAEELAARYSYALGDRRGRYTLNVPRSYLGTNLNDQIQITRTRLPGIEYSEDLDVGNHDRRTRVIGVKKTKDQVTLVLDDQKGIEDANGLGNW